MSDKSSEQLLKLSQKYFALNPLIVLGSGASVPYGMPTMKDLCEHLRETRPDIDVEVWGMFIDKMRNTGDLEASLESYERNLTDESIKHIKNQIWLRLSEHDIALYRDIVNNQVEFALSKLYKILFRSSNNKIDVITTNYDRLAEYATELVEKEWNNGFSQGYYQRFRSFEINSRNRIVNIYKVHGSLDWFVDNNNNIVSLPVREQVPHACVPAVVIPGYNKYRDTHDDPYRTIIQKADNAIESARCCLCIGFGFNDSHIQEKLKQACMKKEIPLIIITKKISQNAKELMHKLKKYLAIEENPGDPCGCRMFTPEYPNGVEVSDRTAWNLDGFLELVTPGE